ncbi:MAG: MBL fold metallo-hydrolase [Candidatus Cloacimonadota bacterium]|nr:MAG: MBL fold metallo-hydrolase [Candidatus Cloacimonadota bacterium]
MIIESFAVGPLGCNCSILACEDTREAIIIDPGDEVEKIKSILNKYDLKVKYLLHTHAHFDHISAAGPLKREGYGEILLHKDDTFLYDMLEEQGRWFGIETPKKDVVDKNIVHKDEIEFGNHKIDVLHTPGHTPGSCCFCLKEKNILFSGDTLFAGSVGRTDLPGGDSKQMEDSIKSHLMSISDDYKIITGHGESTTLSKEMKSNQFLLSWA